MAREQTTIRLPAEAAGVWMGKSVKALHYLFERCVMRVKAVFGVTQIIPNELHVGLDVGDIFLHFCLSSFQIGDVRLHLHEDPEDFFFVVHGAASPLSMDRFYHNAGVTVNNTVGRPSALILQILRDWAKKQAS